jgi:CheY-like chemotaxis protein
MARILIIDDDAFCREFVGDAVAGAGHSCDAARDGVEGLDMIQKQNYDLVIVDRSMPNMTGMEFVAALRQDERFKRQKIIMCTAAEMAGEVAEAFEAGVNDYILKPIELGKLLAKVAKALGQKPAA